MTEEKQGRAVPSWLPPVRCSSAIRFVTCHLSSIPARKNFAPLPTEGKQLFWIKSYGIEKNIIIYIYCSSFLRRGG